MEPAKLVGASVVERLVITVHISGKHVAVCLSGIFPERIIDSNVLQAESAVLQFFKQANIDQ